MSEGFAEIVAALRGSASAGREKLELSEHEDFVSEQFSPSTVHTVRSGQFYSANFFQSRTAVKWYNFAHLLQTNIQGSHFTVS